VKKNAALGFRWKNDNVKGNMLKCYVKGINTVLSVMFIIVHVPIVIERVTRFNL